MALAIIGSERSLPEDHDLPDRETCPRFASVIGHGREFQDRSLNPGSNFRVSATVQSIAGPESAECGSRDSHHEGGVGRAEPLEIHHKVVGFGQGGRSLRHTGP